MYWWRVRAVNDTEQEMSEDAQGDSRKTQEDILIKDSQNFSINTHLFHIF